MFDLPDVLGLSSAASPEKTATNGHHQNGNVLILNTLVTNRQPVSEKCSKVKMNNLLSAVSHF